MSGRIVLLAIAALLGLAGWYMWAISMPVKREAQRQRALEQPAEEPRPQRVKAPTSSAPLAAASSEDTSMVSVWMDPRAAGPLGALTKRERSPEAAAPGLDSPEWFDVVMRSPYSAVEASPGERTKADANLRDYRNRLNALFGLLDAGRVGPAEALIRYRELDAAQRQRDRDIFGDARAAQLRSLRERAYEGLARPAANPR